VRRGRSDQADQTCHRDTEPQRRGDKWKRAILLFVPLSPFPLASSSFRLCVSVSLWQIHFSVLSSWLRRSC
jgi:hypothetical protein